MMSAGEGVHLTLTPDPSPEESVYFELIMSAGEGRALNLKRFSK
jgi:hypothetical protein